MPDERAAADGVAAYWDALVLHKTTDGLAIDEDLAEALARFQAMGAGTPAGARQRVWQRLQAPRARQPAAIDRSRRPGWPTLPAAAAAAGRDAPFVPRRNGVPWRTAHLATAALLVVTLLWNGLLLGSGRLGWRPALPPVTGLEAPERAPGVADDPATRQGLLAAVDVPELPPEAGYVAVERWRYPAASDPVTSPLLTGPMLLYVTAGSIAVSLRGEGGVAQGLNAASPLGMLTPSDGELTAGETLLVPPRTNLTTSNRGDDPATVLVVAILSNVDSDWTLPWNQATIGQEALVSAIGEFAPGPARLTLRRATLAPDETLPAPAGAYQLVAAESTYLGYLSRARDGAVTNREKDPLGVLVLTVTQAGRT